MSETNARICNRCIMDESDPEIVFAEDGTCNHCGRLLERLESRPPLEKRMKLLDGLVSEIKRSGKGKKYDCLIGVSGGVDSTYVAYLCAEYGLRPLAIHLDNGWNSELAVSNIKKTLDTCGIELHTHVMNWNEFKDLQLSFLKASTPGMEVPTDHAILALLYRMSQKYGIKYVISGSNLETEGIMAPSWSEVVAQRDWLMIRNIHREFGTAKLNTFPRFTMLGRMYYKAALRNININILDYIEYNKAEVMEVIREKLGWVYYGGKHYESIYTRFTQGYIQPKKFKFDKRRAHYSALIVSGQIEREEALREMEKSAYPDEELEAADRELFLKKLNLREEDFQAIMSAPVKSYRDYRGYSTIPFYIKANRFALNVHMGLKRFRFYGGSGGKSDIYQ